MADPGEERALCSISVTSELTGVNPQMLRAYESKRLLAPFRTEGGTRRYSGKDLDRISEITDLLAAGRTWPGSSACWRCGRRPVGSRQRSTGSATGRLQGGTRRSQANP